MAERLGLFQRNVLISEAGKGIKWHESFSAGFQIQARFFQDLLCLKHPAGMSWRIWSSGLTLETLKESNDWKRKMNVLRFSLEMIEVRHNIWHVWLFPAKFGVFMCCPASTTGQMELRKARVTVLFVFVRCFVCHLSFSLFLYVLCGDDFFCCLVVIYKY